MEEQQKAGGRRSGGRCKRGTESVEPVLNSRRISHQRIDVHEHGVQTDDGLADAGWECGVGLDAIGQLSSSAVVLDADEEGGVAKGGHRGDGVDHEGSRQSWRGEGPDADACFESAVRAARVDWATPGLSPWTHRESAMTASQ